MGLQASTLSMLPILFSCHLCTLVRKMYGYHMISCFTHAAIPAWPMLSELFLMLLREWLCTFTSNACVPYPPWTHTFYNSSSKTHVKRLILTSLTICHLLWTVLSQILWWGINVVSLIYKTLYDIYIKHSFTFVFFFLYHLIQLMNHTSPIQEHYIYINLCHHFSLLLILI